MRIAVDAMGGDFAPKEIVRGAVDAAKKYDCEIVLIGNEQKIRTELQGEDYEALRISIVHAAEVIGIDIDPQAVLSTAENARINRVEAPALGGDAPLPPPADLVIANILSTPLKLLAPILSSLVAPGGRLVLSGVLERQIDEVASCYDPALNVQAWRTRDGWACLSGRR